MLKEVKKKNKIKNIDTKAHIEYWRNDQRTEYRDVSGRFLVEEHPNPRQRQYGIGETEWKLYILIERNGYGLGREIEWVKVSNMSKPIITHEYDIMNTHECIFSDINWDRLQAPWVIEIRCKVLLYIVKLC